MNMETIAIPFKQITPASEGLGYDYGSIRLTPGNMEDILKFKSIPTSLLGVDKKFNTTTALQVLNAIPEESIQAMVSDEGAVQILDPKSIFVTDEEFENLISRFEFLGDVKKNSEFYSTASLELPAAETDSFLGDIFSKSLKVDRLPQGGLIFNLGLLRLACTNGMRVADKQFKHVIRNGQVEDSLIQAFQADTASFNLDEYFQSLFTKDGVYLPISVGDYRKMKDFLAKMTDPDTSDLYFPMENIENFYADQNIDITKISRETLGRIPSGLRYYDAFNFLTNAMKQVPELSMAEKIQVGQFAYAPRMNALKNTELHFEGMPTFDDALVARLRGDRL